MGKDGRSEEREGVFGNRYTKHYDEKGDAAGWTEERKGLFGDEYAKHYDEKGDAAGWSESGEGLLGNEYAKHFDDKGEGAGWSEQRTGVFGNEYIQHFDAGGNSAGWSEERRGIFGTKYLEHFGADGRKLESVPSKKRRAEEGRESKDERSDESEGEWVFGLIKLGLALAIIMLVLTAAIGAIFLSIITVPLCLATAGVYWAVRKRYLHDSDFASVTVRYEKRKKKTIYSVDDAFSRKYVAPAWHVALLVVPALGLGTLLAVAAYMDADQPAGDRVITTGLTVAASIGSLVISWWAVRLLLDLLVKRAVLAWRDSGRAPESVAEPAIR